MFRCICKFSKATGNPRGVDWSQSPILKGDKSIRISAYSRIVDAFHGDARRSKIDTAADVLGYMLESRPQRRSRLVRRSSVQDMARSVSGSISTLIDHLPGIRLVRMPMKRTLETDERTSHNLLGPASTIAQRSNPRIATSPSGNYVVTWVDNENFGSSPLYARAFNADGSPRSAEIVVTPARIVVSSDATQPVSINANGDFAVAYLGRPASSFVSHIYVQRYLADGTLRGNLIDAGQEPRGLPAPFDRGALLFAPAVALNDAGELVVAWVSSQYTGIASTIPIGDTDRLYSRRYRADGSATGAAQFTAFRVRGLIDPRIRIAMSNTGDYAIAYREPSFFAFPIYAQIYNADGTRKGTTTHFSPLSPLRDIDITADFAVTYVANGDLALAWIAPDSVATTTIEHVMFRRFSPLGLGRADAVEVATRGQDYERSSLSISPLPAGGVAVTWPDTTREIQSGTAYGRYYAANDAPLGSAFVIANNVRQAVSTTDALGNLVTAYGDVFARTFRGP